MTGGGTQTYTVTNLRPFFNYNFALTAVNSGGEGPPSIEVFAPTEEAGKHYILVYCMAELNRDGGGVVEWLGRRAWNREVPGSSPVLTTIWSCFTVAPSSTPRPRL